MAGSPFELYFLGLRSGLMMFQAQQVIAMRMLGMVGAWRTGGGEPARMLTEKLTAMDESRRAVQRAVSKGASPAAVGEAALKPYAKRTSANHRRLSRSGPKSPL